MDQEKIGKFIKTLRNEKNMTQEDLAYKLNVSNKSISRWENAKTMPDLSMLLDLSNELGVEVSELLKGQRMTKEELLIQRDVINNLIAYSNEESKMKKDKINNYLKIGIMCLVLMIINNQFGIIENLINNHVSEFINGALVSIGLLFEFIGALKNNNISLREKKINFFKKSF